MAKKLLAVFLSALMLLGVFAVGATASSDAAEPPVFTAEEAATIVANWTCLEDFIAEFAPQGWLWSADPDRVPSSITNRTNRYMERVTPALAGEAFLIVIVGAINASQASTQLSANRALNTMNNELSSLLRGAGEMNILQGAWSWFRGQIWWIWLPVLVAVAGVGVWFFTQA